MVNHPSPLESTYNIGGSTDTPLGDFLKRPVLIYEKSPGLSARVNESFRPWQLFLNNVDVRRRIEGFRHLRGRLHVRAVCTGNPFLYGLYALCYRPYFDRSSHVLGSVFNAGRYIQQTSCPHVFIDPTTSEGGEMVLPFFCPFNWIDLTDSKQFSDMGRMFFETLVPLQHANSATGTFNVQVYAWMEEVELCTPTAAGYDFWTLQSSMSDVSASFLGAFFNFLSFIVALLGSWALGKDHVAKSIASEVTTSLRSEEEEQPQNEFAERPISTAATAVAKGAGWLAKVPAIAPYARATEMGANVTAAVARAFGYSRPREISNITRVRRVANGDFSTTNTGEPIPRLGLDAKGELTIDPRTVGLSDTDEMSFDSITQKDVVFAFVDWAESDVSGATLHDIAVTPFHGCGDSTTTPIRTMLTPVAGIASLFRFWSGSLIFRFRIVASSMHRGKIRISYDPVTTVGGALNEQYSRIVDISSTRDFEIPVNWHATTPWLRCQDPVLGVAGGMNNAATIATARPDMFNGILRLSVFTPLTSPDPSAGNDVQIVVSVRAGSDFKVARPMAFDGRNWSYRSSNVAEQPQSLMADDKLGDDNMPVTASPEEPIGPASIPETDKSTLVFMGEHVTTLRSLLKRYRYHSDTGGTAYLNVRRTIPTGGVGSMGVLEYVMAWYTGWRGSIRVKGVRGADDLMMVNISDNGDNADVTTGMTDVGCEYMQGIAEAEIPFYSQLRFAIAQTNSSFANYGNNSFGEDDPNGVKFRTFSWTNTGANIKRYTAIGEDFSLFFFTGIPPLYG